MPGATIAPDKTFFDLDPQQFQTVLNLNLTGTVIPTQVFLQPMVKQGKGAIGRSIVHANGLPTRHGLSLQRTKTRVQEGDCIIHRDENCDFRHGHGI